MSLNGLVHPDLPKCESLNWRWVRANQLAPQGLGPAMDTRMQCEYGDIAPYTDPRLVANMQAMMPLRVWGYPNVTPYGRMTPLIYFPKRDPKPQNRSGLNHGQCTCASDDPSWPYVIQRPSCGGGYR